MNQMAGYVALVIMLMLMVPVWTTSSQEQGRTQLIFKGVVYSNNSILPLSDVGDSFNNNAIHCVTNKSPCCSTPPNRFGEWYYPDGSRVPNNAAGEKFYRGRGDDRSIHLSRRNNASSPIGSYCCELPDDSDVIHRLCVVLAPTVIELSVTRSSNFIAGHSYILTCTARIVRPSSSDTNTINITWFDSNGSMIPSGVNDTRTVSETMYNETVNVSTSLLQFQSIQPEHAGVYTCQATIATLLETATTQVNVSEQFTVMLEGMVKQVILGQTLNLMCIVSIRGEERLNISTKYYEWFMEHLNSSESMSESVNTFNLLAGENQSSLNISSVQVFNVGRYRCRVTINSISLRRNVTESSNTLNLTTLLFPPPLAVTVTASPGYIALSGSSLTLNCSVEVDVTIISLRERIPVTVSTMWRGPFGMIQFNHTAAQIATRVNDTTYTGTLTLNPIEAHNSGVYICSAFVTSSPSEFLSSSGTVMSFPVTINVVPIQLFHQDVSYPNNSLLSLSDVQEFSITGNTIFCKTGLYPCCESTSNTFAEWYYPNGSVVPSMDAGHPFYSVKSSDQRIYLNRRNSTSSVTGSFCCELPDFHNVSHRLCVQLEKATLQVNTLPSALFEANDGVHNVVEGSVLQLYCSVELTTASITWTRNSTPIIIDVPHVHVRTESNGTHVMSVLTLDNFATADDGVYQCHVGDTNDTTTGRGNTLTLFAINSSSIGSLVIRQDPVHNEVLFEGLIQGLSDNRTSILLGSTVDEDSIRDEDKLLKCVVGHHGDNDATFTTPIVEWIKDGQTLSSSRSQGRVSVESALNGIVSSTLQISNFQESNAGVYQCVFTDGDIDREIITTTPLRLDTGEMLTINRVSPGVIILQPPEKLVIEVKASGRYRFITWERNGVDFSDDPQAPFFVRVESNSPGRSELPHFFEIFVREPTTTEDLGVYEAQLVPADVNNQQIERGGQVQFIVAPPVSPTVNVTSDPVVTVLERHTTTITCNATGIPTPSIVWEFNGTQTSFPQTDETHADISARIIAVNNVLIIPGRVTSHLHVVNVSHETHNGMYTCTGVNSYTDSGNASTTTTTAMDSVVLQVYVIPEIRVTSNLPQNRINIGGTITLTCTVARAYPPVHTFTWRHNDISGSVTQDAIYTLVNVREDQLGMYTCQANNAAGSGNGTITITKGYIPLVTVVQPAPVVIHNTVELICIVTGDTPLNITWSNHNSIRDGIVYSGDHNMGGNTTLMVNGQDDYGNYTCSATNTLGAHSETISIIQATAPILFQANQSYKLVVGERLTLSGNITGFNLPITNIIWTQNGSIISNATDRNITIITTSHTNIQSRTGVYTVSFLTINNVRAPEDTGAYTVTATNPVGSDTMTFDVTVCGVPGMPGPVMISLITSQRAVITWQQPVSCVPIISYTILVQMIVNGTLHTNYSENRVLPSTNLSLVVEDLQPNQSFEAFVKAENRAGIGEGASTKFETPPDVLLFQLRLFGFPSCKDLITRESSTRLTFLDGISTAIVSGINVQCKQCGFTGDYITSDELYCFEESDNAVTYRAELHETKNLSVHVLVSHMEQWINNMSHGPPITVQSTFFQVDTSCTIIISSFQDEECTMSSNSHPDPNIDVMMLVVTIVPSVAAVLLAIVTTVIIVCVACHRWRKQTSQNVNFLKRNTPTDLSGTESYPTPVKIELSNIASQTPNDDSEEIYDDVIVMNPQMYYHNDNHETMEAMSCDEEDYDDVILQAPNPAYRTTAHTLAIAATCSNYGVDV